MDTRRASASPLRQLFYDLLVFFADKYRDKFGFTAGPPLHDPIAVAIILESLQGESVTSDDDRSERWDVDVVTDGLHSDRKQGRNQLGRTLVSRAEEGGVRIPVKLNVQRFWTLIDGCLQRAEMWVDSQKL